MSQFRLIEPQQATPETRQMLEQVQDKLGRLPNMFKAMTIAPAVLTAYLNFSQAMSASNLTAKLREQIALTVSERNGCQYCLAAHTAIGKRLGLSEDEINDNRRAESSDETTSAALAFVASLVDKQGKVSGNDIESLRLAGFDDGKIAEIAAATSLTILTNYFNITSAAPIDFPKVQPITAEVCGANCSL